MVKKASKAAAAKPRRQAGAKDAAAQAPQEAGNNRGGDQAGPSSRTLDPDRPVRIYADGEAGPLGRLWD